MLELCSDLWAIVCDDLVRLTLPCKLCLAALYDCLCRQVREQFTLPKVRVVINDEKIVLLSVTE